MCGSTGVAPCSTWHICMAAWQHGRYLEDHTGFADLGPEDFEERRKFFESPDFDWYKQRPGARLSAACIENNLSSRWFRVSIQAYPNCSILYHSEML